MVTWKKGGDEAMEERTETVSVHLTLAQLRRLMQAVLERLEYYSHEGEQEEFLECARVLQMLLDALQALIGE